MKIAKIIPVHKSNVKDDISNYRPISLLPSISKILGKGIYKRTFHFIQSNKILNNNQYGFREKHSTINAITALTGDVIKALENKDSVLSVFLDLSKAFDTIDHQILLHKLEFYGIRGTPLKWFKSYLTNRKQYVKYNNSDSLQQDITFGVPQGSILGLLLFIIYINDLPFCVNHCKTILFADDTTIYKTGKQVNNIYEDMNNDLQVLADWFRANKLSLNISKTKSMLFCRSPPPENEELILTMSDTIIQRIKCLQFLGLYIDEKLDWHEHINKCKNKLTSALYVINKVNSYLPVSALKTIYYTLVYPYLTYGIILWGSTYKTYLTKLFIIQKKIV